MEAFVAWYSGSYYRAVRHLEPHDRPYWWASLGAGVLQRRGCRRRSGSRGAHEPGAAVRRVDRRERRDVLEGYVIVVTSLHRDYLPGSWGMYAGTSVGLGHLPGTIGLFLTLFYLFMRVLPMIMGRRRYD